MKKMKNETLSAEKLTVRVIKKAKILCYACTVAFSLAEPYLHIYTEQKQQQPKSKA